MYSVRFDFSTYLSIYLMFIRVSAGIVSVFCRTCVCVSLDEKKREEIKTKGSFTATNYNQCLLRVQKGLSDRGERLPPQFFC